MICPLTYDRQVFSLRTIIQQLLPHKAISKLAHFMANLEITWIKNYLIQDFVNRYQVDMSQAIEPDPTAYQSFNAFFTRQLKPELRPLPAQPNCISSPADGVVSAMGPIDRTALLQAKGHTYELSDLLGGDVCEATPFINGQFMTIYLSPKDYHRVHMPVSGQLLQMVYVPGRLFSVNQDNTEHLPNLFARNERVVCIFDTPIGKMAVILVGAMIVGSMETSWHGPVTPPHLKTLQCWHYHHDNNEHISLKQGEELGLFKLGSTVIVLFENQKMAWSQSLNSEASVQVNQAIGQFEAD